MVEAVENADGDAWIARLHDDPYHRSTDIIFENTENRELFEVSLKATDNPAYVEHALSRYPGDTVVVTSEAADAFKGDDRVTSSRISNDEVEKVTEGNFDNLLEQTEPSNLDALSGVLAGTSLAAAATLWPFFIAWKRGRITQTQFVEACLKVLGNSGKRVVWRLAGALAL